MARIEVIPRSQLEATEKALGEIRRATNYDNAVGQLKKIERIADAALSQHTAEGEG